jgi:AcrR family transcriptional regulator
MSKDAVIPKLLGVFQQYGYEGATLARLSEATGLGRASLYHHFPKGKEEMATTVLDYLTQGLRTQILAPLYSDRPPVERLRAMNEILDQFYSQGEKSCLLSLLNIGEAHDLFQTQIQQMLELWIESLAKVAIESGIKPKIARQRAEDAVLQIEGALVVSRGLNNKGVFNRVLKHLPEMLLSSE